MGNIKDGSSTERVIELDVLRGFAVVIMILSVSPGDWSFTYEPLRHADWNGWNLVDLVFPDFLFGVGMALGLTFGKSIDPVTQAGKFWLKILRRVTLLIVLGLALNALSVIAFYLGTPSIRPGEIPTLRIPGVLQRIAVCYLIAVMIVTATARRSTGGSMQINTGAVGIVIALLLIGYWALMTFVPVPGFGAGKLDPEGNLAAYIDRFIFTTDHLWRLGSEKWAGPVVYDPEGLLSSIPATANVLFGVIAIGIWRSEHRARIAILAGLGGALIAAALLLDGIFPINKRIWTSSFALLTSGISFLALLIAATLTRGGFLKIIAAPFRILGGNAILAFSLSIFLGVLAGIPLTGGDQPQGLQKMGMDLAKQVIPDSHLASFACASSVLALIFVIIWLLDRKKIYLKV